LALTITGLAAGTCTATATDTHGQTASLQITVTVSNVGLDAIGRTVNFAQSLTHSHTNVMRQLGRTNHG
jgi:uncharacterized protein YjdB